MSYAYFDVSKPPHVAQSRGHALLLHSTTGLEVSPGLGGRSLSWFASVVLLRGILLRPRRKKGKKKKTKIFDFYRFYRGYGRRKRSAPPVKTVKKEKF